MRCKYENKILRVNSSMKIVKVLSAQLCLTPCYPMDYSMPGSTEHGVSQARVLEVSAIH